jgi:hypothetical protein
MEPGVGFADMGFEVPVSGVDRVPAQGGRVVAAALCGLVTVVVLAIATGGTPPRRQVAAATREAPGVASSATAGSTVPRAVPTALTCRDLDVATCRRMAKAALLALPDDAPEAIDATAWRSLLCNSSFDCPPSYIDGAVPLGSVIIRFADRGPRAAINVVEGRSGPIHRAARAWVVRWLPEPG